MKAFIAACSIVFFANGCYVEEMPDRAPTPPGGGTPLTLDAKDGKKTKPEKQKGECFHDSETGCVEGHISSAMNFSVSGKSFFDADDLANRFHEIVEIRSTDGKVLTDGKDYELTLVSTFSNKNFAKDFQVFIKGERTESAEVRSSGKFFFNQLPEGEYDIRVQRPIKMLVKIKQLEGEPIESVDCATLYQDGSFDVVKDEKSDPMNFDDLSLYTTAAPCAP
jgi:hypothetical protein